MQAYTLWGKSAVSLRDIVGREATAAVKRVEINPSTIAAVAAAAAAAVR
jgi:hypothetical protein